MEAHHNSCHWKANCQLSKSWLSRSWPKGPRCQLVWGVMQMRWVMTEYVGEGVSGDELNEGCAYDLNDTHPL